MPELFHRYPGNPILTAADWPYPVNAVFNPGATRFNNEVLLLVRVEDFQGLSHLTVARSPDGRSSWRVNPEPTLLPDPLHHPEEFWGIEDPRIVFLEEEGLYAVTYVAYSRGGPLVALATTADFQTFHRLGPILPPEDKDASLFPRRFKGRWAMIHRPMPTAPGARPNIWISFSPDLRHWGDHTVIIEARPGGWWDSDRVGLGPQPIETPEGWLILYHGVRQTASGRIYRVGMALLDLEDPRKVIRRSAEWVFGPRAPYERIGDVPNVTFPCGAVVDPPSGELLMYYGAADTCVALATANLQELLDYLRHAPV